MNRRSFFLTASASLALASNRALAQRGNSGSSDVLVSELTGGEVDISGTSLPMVNQHIDDGDGTEHFHFEVLPGGQFDIILYPDTLGDPDEFIQGQVRMFHSVMPGEILSENSFGDGSWIAFDFGDGNSVGYYETQLNAYPGHHLVLTFNSQVASFSENFEQAQAVLIDGMPPFLFLEESDILGIVEERAESTSASTGSRTTRGSSDSDTSSRSSRTSSRSDDDEEEDTRGTRSSSGGGDAVETIKTHRDEFVDSYNEFYSLLELVADENASDAEVEDGFAELLLIAQNWQQYPDQAAEIEFDSSQSDLEITYLEWADLVAELGLALEDIIMGVGDVDEFLDIYDEWSLVDEDLQTQLRAMGFGFSLFASKTTSPFKMMKSARFAA